MTNKHGESNLKLPLLSDESQSALLILGSLLKWRIGLIRNDSGENLAASIFIFFWTENLRISSLSVSVSITAHIKLHQHLFKQEKESVLPRSVSALASTHSLAYLTPTSLIKKTTTIMNIQIDRLASSYMSDFETVSLASRFIMYPIWLLSHTFRLLYSLTQERW